jgi:nitrogen regulatory protein P-II 2
MKYVIAIIRPERLDAVKHELQHVEVNRLTVSSVSGYGAQKGYLEVYDSWDAGVEKAHEL